MTYVNRTHIRYIPIGSIIRVATGEFKRSWHGLRNEPIYAYYEIVFKGGDFNATMDVDLVAVETGEHRQITVSPSRYFKYYVIEKF